jgi:hypothetical protein
MWPESDTGIPWPVRYDLTRGCWPTCAGIAADPAEPETGKRIRHQGNSANAMRPLIQAR